MTETAYVKVPVELVDKMSSQLESIRRQSEKTFVGSGGLEKHAKRAAVGIAALGAAGLAAAYSMSRMTMGIAKDADQLLKLSQRLGTSVEGLSELRYVAERSGVTFQTMSMALQRMTRRVGEAAQGTGEAVLALQQLNINAAELNRLAPEDQFEKIAGQIALLRNQSDKVRLAFKLFDSEGVSLLQTMEDGAVGIRKLREEARQTGEVISTDLAKRSADLNDKLRTLEGTIKGIKIQFAEKLIDGGMVELLTVKLQDESFRRGIDSMATSVSNLAKSMTGFVSWVGANPENVQLAIALAGAMGGGAVGAKLGGIPGALIGGTAGATGAMAMTNSTSFVPESRGAPWWKVAIGVAQELTGMSVQNRARMGLLPSQAIPGLASEFEPLLTGAVGLGGGVVGPTTGGPGMSFRAGANIGGIDATPGAAAAAAVGGSGGGPANLAAIPSAGSIRMAGTAAMFRRAQDTGRIWQRGIQSGFRAETTADSGRPFEGQGMGQMLNALARGKEAIEPPATLAGAGFGEFFTQGLRDKISGIGAGPGGSTEDPLYEIGSAMGNSLTNGMARSLSFNLEDLITGDVSLGGALKAFGNEMVTSIVIGVSDEFASQVVSSKLVQAGIGAVSSFTGGFIQHLGDGLMGAPDFLTGEPVDKIKNFGISVGSKIKEGIGKIDLKFSDISGVFGADGVVGKPVSGFLADVAKPIGLTFSSIATAFSPGGHIGAVLGGLQKIAPVQITFSSIAAAFSPQGPIGSVLGTLQNIAPVNIPFADISGAFSSEGSVGKAIGGFAADLGVDGDTGKKIAGGLTNALVGGVTGAAIGSLIGGEITTHAAAIGGALGGALAGPVGSIIGSIAGAAASKIPVVGGLISSIFGMTDKDTKKGLKELGTDVQAFGGISGFFQRIGGFTGLRSDRLTTIQSKEGTAAMEQAIRLSLGATSEQASDVVKVLRSADQINTPLGESFRPSEFKSSYGDVIRLLRTMGFSEEQLSKVRLNTTGVADPDASTTDTPQPPTSTDARPRLFEWSDGTWRTTAEPKSKTISKSALRTAITGGTLDAYMARLDAPAGTPMQGLAANLRDLVGDVPTQVSGAGQWLQQSLGFDIVAARGFQGIVNRPTRMLVGEAGPESVSVIPQGKGYQGGSSAGGVTNIYFAPNVYALDVTSVRQSILNGELGDLFMERVRRDSELRRDVLHSSGVVTPRTV